MFEKVLVANRGEIAVRIIRACRELGIRTVAVFSDVDEDSLHVRLADEAYSIGPAMPNQSYLNVPALIEVAGKAEVDAIHPGYGFLAENSHFAAVCRTWGIEFIGPRPDAIERMGYKSIARETMLRADVPVIPGMEGPLGSDEEAAIIAAELGYPVMVKAVAGGGGRGIRVAYQAEELADSLKSARREAEASFGNGDLYLEKFLEEPRHVEVQILADSKGNVIHLGERECSIQRRMQKVLEEAPSPIMTPELREEMTAAAVRAAQAVDYTGAGTVEFLVDRHGQFYFLEMNTRIQVEHPLTEMLTGVDLVKEQIRVAAGQPLSVKQEDIQLRGWALECRINAEDPDNRFMPSPGTITEFRVPGGPGVRVDEGIYTGYTIQPYYDSLICKIITWGEDRQEALARMERALGELEVEGVVTTADLHRYIISHPEFQSGDIHTRWLEEEILGQG